MSVDSLAKQAQMNEYKFSCLFKLMFKYSVHQFIINEKLENARELLKTGEHSISQVAFLSGYDSPAAFSTIFKKKYGYPPSMFRR